MAEGPFDTLDATPTEDGRGQEGRLLAGRYRIVRKLGEGGMGMVYLAEDIELANHKVAIKFIPPMLAGNARAVKNLQREAVTAMRLTHSSIVRLHDLHTDGHQKFLVMEYVDGKTLDDLLAEREGERIPLEELLPIARQVAAALDYAHSRSVLHRDLKPSNIMIGADGVVKLLDFGIAREMKDSYTRVTGQETSGTLPYMSPEQLMGGKPSVAMDVYSFGAVLYECLAGHPPFHMGDIREQIKSKSPDPLANVVPSVNETLLSALSKDPKQRPRSAADLVSRLQSAPPMPDRPRQVRTQRPDADGPKVSHSAVPSCLPLAGQRSKRSHGWLVALVVLACVVGGVAFLSRPNTPRQPSAPEPGSIPPSQPPEQTIPAPAPESVRTGQPGTDAGTRQAIIEQQRIPPDLIEVSGAQYAPLDGLAPGSREAQERQRRLVETQNLASLPLEVKTTRTGIVFRLIPAGSFTMGSPKSEQDTCVNAGAPREWVQGEVQHHVTLTKPFYCGKYEVTQGQWEAVMESNPATFKNAGRDAPIETVSWEDCQAFVKKLCQMEGVPEGTYRLLTEAQWEYACRAGTSTALYTGDLVIRGANNGPALDPIGWYGGNSGVQYAGGVDSSSWPDKQYNHRSAGTHPVGQKLANGWGLYDMIGNVWEWCDDPYGEYASSSATDPLGPASGGARVIRGGGWNLDAGYCRSAGRYRDTPAYRYGYLGLRLARTAPSYP